MAMVKGRDEWGGMKRAKGPGRYEVGMGSTLKKGPFLGPSNFSRPQFSNSLMPQWAAMEEKALAG